MVDKPHTTIESRMAGLDEARLARTAEEAIDPQRPIIDPHHHLWDFPTHRYLLDELLHDTNSGHRIEKTVFIECAVFYRPPERAQPPEMDVLGEVEAINGLAAMSASGRYGATEVAAGIIGMADLKLGAPIEAVLEAQIRAGGGRFKGIRHCAGYEDKTLEIHNSHTNPPPHLYRDHKGFREGFGKLGALGLSFEAWLYHPQLDDLLDLARAFPEQKMVLNHAGGPLGLGYYSSRKKEVFDTWRASIIALAQCPNVHIKLGGLGMLLCGFEFEKRPESPSSQELADAWRPYIETCIEAFGSERAMFESNFPVDKLSGSYVNYWNAFKRLAANASDAEKSALFYDTAAQYYELN